METIEEFMTDREEFGGRLCWYNKKPKENPGDNKHYQPFDWETVQIMGTKLSTPTTIDVEQYSYVALCKCLRTTPHNEDATGYQIFLQSILAITDAYIFVVFSPNCCKYKLPDMMKIDSLQGQDAIKCQDLDCVLKMKYFMHCIPRLVMNFADATKRHIVFTGNDCYAIAATAISLHYVEAMPQNFKPKVACVVEEKSCGEFAGLPQNLQIIPKSEEVLKLVVQDKTREIWTDPKERMVGNISVNDNTVLDQILLQYQNYMPFSQSFWNLEVPFPMNHESYSIHNYFVVGWELVVGVTRYLCSLLGM